MLPKLCAMFLHSGFMTLESRSCLFRILRIVIQQRRPEPLLSCLLRAQSVLFPFTSSLTPWVWSLGYRIRFCRIWNGGRGPWRKKGRNNRGSVGISSNVGTHVYSLSSPTVCRTVLGNSPWASPPLVHLDARGSSLWLSIC